MNLFLGIVILLIGEFAQVLGATDNELPPDFGQTNTNCPNFRCSGGFTPTPKPRGKFESTGCSAMGNSFMMTPGDTGEEAFAPCCDQFHACNQICGISKTVCDEAFTTCSSESCGDDDECNKAASMNQMMAKISGCQKFDQAQYKACECTPKEKAPEKRAAAIRYFYKKVSPGNLAKVDELAKKADTASKLAGLFRKLLTKYPEAIKKVEDPMQNMFRNIKVETKEDEETNDAQEDEEIEEIEL
jgi:hypothetical protein